MAKDTNVISLESRRRGSKPADQPERAGPRPVPDAPPAPEQKPVPGRLIWLYCPTCRSIEYTELALPGGRRHNECGTVVQEAPMELDLRAEATIAHVNLERLEILASLLQGQRQRYEEYLQRLNLAAGRTVEPYRPAAEGGPRLPAEDTDAFGLLVSPFFRDPATRFPELAQAPDDAPAHAPAGAPGAPPEGSPPEPEDV